MPGSSWLAAAGWAGGAQSANAPLIAMAVLVVLLPSGIVLILWSYRHRRKPVAQQCESFAALFDGRPMVFFNAYQWSFDEAEARRIAHSRSYHETTPAYHSRIRWLRFVPD
jgi:hypothetical protein